MYPFRPKRPATNLRFELRESIVKFGIPKIVAVGVAGLVLSGRNQKNMVSVAHFSVKVGNTK